MSEHLRSSRISDPIEIHPGTLEIEIHSNGDAVVRIKGIDQQGKPTESQIQFLAPCGGGYHPCTILALLELAKAMKVDNNDPDSPPRYNPKLV